MAEQMEKVNCDILILGGGPAGLSSAIYGGRAKLNVILLEESTVGGQAASTYHIANYPGTPGVIRGSELTENMKKQAQDFGVNIISGEKILEVDLTSTPKVVKTEDKEFSSKAVIIAAGAKPRKLPAEGAESLHSRGVHYCATCDGPFYQGKKVIVVGGGNSALEEAGFLTKFADEVTIVHQFDHFQGTKLAQEEVFKNPKIKVKWNSTITKVHGENMVEKVTMHNSATGEDEVMEIDGVFVYIGTEPKTQLFGDQLELDKWGYIVTDCEMRTKVEGVFAAGDIRNKEVRQAITAAGDGATAAINAEKYLNH